MKQFCDGEHPHMSPVGGAKSSRPFGDRDALAVNSPIAARLRAYLDAANRRSRAFKEVA